MNPKIAVIDLGTNGFRLYIAEITARGQYQIIHKKAYELKLASEGIHRIGEAPFQRGLAAMKDFSIILDEYKVLKIKAFATAAVRIAENGLDFIEAVRRETNINIELITGEREAELIYKGMALEIPLSIQPVVMVDIGGGSVEFIIADKNKMLWAHSFNIGVAILKQRFHFQDPITQAEIQEIHAFLEQETQPFLAQLTVFKPKIPIIASGTLDYIVKILRGGYLKPYCNISAKKFNNIYQKLTFLSEKELAAIPNVPKDKIEMNTVCMVLMQWLVEKMQATQLIASANSMKAGILYEMSLGL